MRVWGLVGEESAEWCWAAGRGLHVWYMGAVRVKFRLLSPESSDVSGCRSCWRCQPEGHAWQLWAERQAAAGRTSQDLRRSVLLKERKAYIVR